MFGSSRLKDAKCSHWWVWRILVWCSLFVCADIVGLSRDDSLRRIWETLRSCAFYLSVSPSLSRSVSRQGTRNPNSLSSFFPFFFLIVWFQSPLFVAVHCGFVLSTGPWMPCVLFGLNKSLKFTTALTSYKTKHSLCCFLKIKVKCLKVKRVYYILGTVKFPRSLKVELVILLFYYSS